MSIKNLTQPSLADVLVHNHKHLQELDGLQALIDGEEIGRELKVSEVKDTGNSASSATRPHVSSICTTAFRRTHT